MKFHTIKDTNRQPTLTNMPAIKKHLKRNANNPKTHLSICHRFFKILLLNETKKASLKTKDTFSVNSHYLIPK